MRNTIFFITVFLCFNVYGQLTARTIEKSKNHIQYLYRDSIISMEKWMDDDKRLDSVKTYYPTGKLDEVFHYKNGKLHGKGFKHNAFGRLLTTWDFKEGILQNRVDHHTDYNKKDSLKIADAVARIQVLNAKLLENPRDNKSVFERTNLRISLNNKILAHHDLFRLRSVIFKMAKQKHVEPPKKLLANTYDKIAAIYSTWERDNFTAHYRFLACKADPENNRIKYNFATHLFAIKSYRLAIHYLEEVLVKWPKHNFSHRILANIYSDFENYEKANYHVNIAFQDTTGLIKFGSGKVERDLWTIRGLASHKLGATEQGLLDLEKALNKNPNNSFAYRNLGLIYFDQKEYARACKNLKRAKSLGYTAIYDTYDIENLINSACLMAEETAKTDNALAKEELSKQTERLLDKPFVYPNPSKDVIRVKNFSSENFDYEVYDYTSKLVLKNKATAYTMDIASLPQGVYILRISKDNTSASFHIVKE